MNRIVLVCEDNFDGIMTAIYEAWNHRGEQVSIRVKDNYDMELFSQYINVPVDYEKSEKVINTVTKKISMAAMEIIYNVACSAEEDKCSAILAFVIHGLERGSSVVCELTNPYVQRCNDICRKVTNEAYFYREILRFEEIEGGILYAGISPRANVMVSIMEHFSDRFPDENFIIYDDNRHIGGIHRSRQQYFIQNNMDMDQILKNHREGMQSPGTAVHDDYTQLWKIFFDSIAIKERRNDNLQRNNVPLLYRKHMTEFQ